MPVEHLLQPGLIGFERTSDHADVIEPVAMHLDELQNAAAQSGQFFFGSDDVRDRQFHVSRR